MIIDEIIKTTFYSETTNLQRKIKS